MGLKLTWQTKMFGQAKLIGLGVVALAFLSVSGGAAWYKHQSDKWRKEAQIASYSYDNAVAALHQYSDEIVARNKEIGSLTGKFNTAKEFERKNTEVFDRHDIQNLLENKPGLVADWASDKLNGMFDDVSGSSGGPGSPDNAP